MEFLKRADVLNMLMKAKSQNDLIREFEKLTIYKAEYKPYMPIKLRDYGWEGEPVEFDCGHDQSHDWLEITDSGELCYRNMQNGAGSMSESAAKSFGECCFVPTYEHEDEFGEKKGFITPETVLVIEESEGD